MTTKTDFHSIKELKEKYTPVQRGIVSRIEAETIQEVLELGQRNDIELQNIRDASVMLYSQWTDSQQKNGNTSEAIKLMDTMECCVCRHRRGKVQTWASGMKVC